MKNNYGTIFKISKGSAHDGPGLRTVVHFKGCPLRCIWCHNPAGLLITPQLMFYSSLCIKDCLRCVNACAQGCFSIKDGKVLLNRSSCTNCMACVDKCPTGALATTGYVLDAVKLVDEILKDKHFYLESGGGVTFSGGECTFQYSFLLAALKLCKERGINTAIDTAAHIEWEKLYNLCPYVDYFLIDIKHMDSEQHRKLTGSGNKLILKNIKRLSKTQANIIIRIPLIPSINDSTENLQATANFIASCNGNIIKTELLPYNDLGAEKYNALSLNYLCADLKPYTKEQLKRLNSIFADKGL